MSVPIRRFVNVNVAFANFVDGESVGNESIDTNGNLYEWHGPALGWVQTHSGGAALVTQDGWAPTGGTTALPDTIFDLPDDSAALSATGAPTLASIKSKTYTPAENVTAVMCCFHLNATDATVPNPGCYVAINAASNGVSELTSGGARYWIPAGTPRLLKFGVVITSVHAVGLTTQANNQLDLEPF